MKWNKFTIKTIAEAEDIIVSSLMELGIEGAEIEDNIPLSEYEKSQMFVDILPENPNAGNDAYVSFYIEDGQETEELLASVKEELASLAEFMEVGECTITESQTEDADWQNKWKEYFKQFYVDDILIKPSWEELKPEDEGKMRIDIDPGTAFGTGMHETTQLCIRQIKKLITKDTVMLDAGTGSGILSIAGIKLGASYALGTDLDPCAITAVAENMQANGISEDKYDVILGNLIDDKEVQDKVGYEKYDLVCANILAEILVAMTPVIPATMKKGAYYVTSGILKEKEELVKDVILKSGLEVVEVTYQNDWCSITAKKA
ncbi:MAG: 50S ribosomal protein L11 methyltransferase [Lachnospiraceae bacterium]|nr:50S ribosomal protein L11 methyltransferase [Lachnospiraceae bacterium]